jgi:hypothetical protein
MSRRADLVRMFVLNSISDDYEEIGQITKDVSRDANNCGMVIESIEIVTALRELFDSGLAKAYRLYATSRPPEELAAMPTPDEMKNRGAYFWITGEGMKVQLRDDSSWPFEEIGVVRKDWTPPED